MLPTINSYKDGIFYDTNGRPLAYLADGERAFAALSNSGTVIAAQAGYRIRVYGLVVSALAATTVKFQSSTGSVDISVPFYLAATGGFVLPQCNATGWFETAVGDALNLNMTAPTSVGIQVIYALVR